MESPWDMGTKVCSYSPGHMSKMATLNNLLLRNRKSDGVETCYAASSAQVLSSLFNDDPGLALTYFTARSNLIHYAVAWETGKTMDFSETIVVYDLKLTTDDRSDK